ncbi:MAG: nucleotide sugar dehydrogenase [Planctomycetes bacterium]|nr:nucleotide sugar dehydrogenase [Planctomycetota bacterium]
MADLVARLKSGDAHVGVVGLGYVGLPLSHAFCKAGFKVLGLDVDESKVESLNAGRSYIGAVSDESLAEMRADERFLATSDYARASDLDAIAICVPTPLTIHRDPDMSYIEATAKALAPHLSADTLVVLESTTYPGTTSELLGPLLAEGSGLTLGQDLLVAYSPERENPGSDWSTAGIPKVVGADEDLGRAAAEALYERSVIQVVAVSSTRAAEATKLLENIYRCVNIALVNELKVCFDAMDINVFEVIEAAKTKPFGFQAFYPGPGLGGHCIPIDPFYLSWKARGHGVPTRFIELAGEVNAAMPEFVLSKVADALNARGKAFLEANILILGVAYKPDVSDIRESPALVLIERLRSKGAQVSYHDPHVPRLTRGRHYSIDLESVELSEAALAASDAVLIVTDHSSVDYAAVQAHASLVIDTRGVLRGLEGSTATIVQA